MNEWTNEQMNEWTNERMNELINIRIIEWTNEWIENKVWFKPLLIESVWVYLVWRHKQYMTS